ncbi:MAG: hypothetical protein LBV63_02690 [Candidatus Methanoplasma sp.]|jgi:hypothetical protein|nr:hypothetical protein [Candidatus Methanoplasma sp.]
MLMMARDRDYPALRDLLKGRKVALWTCNTCARLCNGIGGTESASKLADALRSDGIDVVGVMYTSASCLQDKVRAKADATVLDKADTVVSLTCDIGSVCAGHVFEKEMINPVVTFGPGLILEDGSLLVCNVMDGKAECTCLDEVSSEAGLSADPYV